MPGHRLAIDFGTSSTVAVLADPDGRARPLLFDGSPLLASNVFARPGGDELLTGADAERAALGYPAGLEVNPKRRIDERVLWLGDRECDIIDQSSRVADYVITFEETLERALGSDESLELIQQIAKEMT